MKEYLKERNMRRENVPASTTLDVGLNNNPVEREDRSPAVSEDTENENFWVTDGVGLSANYEWCWESGSSVDDPEELSSEYGLGWEEEDNRPNNWKPEASKKTSSGWKSTSDDVTRDQEIVSETSNNVFNDNEFNNNEAVLHPIAGDSVNQLDICKNEEKSFYEKPKLNIQSVSYLYDSVLPPTVKCMNYVNSIKAPIAPEKLSSPGGRIDEPEVTSLRAEEKIEAVEEPKSSPGARSTEESIDGRSSSENEIEVVELTKSVKEVIQFPEIEEITERPEITSDSAPLSSEANSIIDHIDLIREAKELTIDPVEVPDGKASIGLPQLAEDVVKEIDAKIEEIDLLSSIGRDIGVDLEKYVQPVPDVVAMEAVKHGPRSLPNLLKDARTRQDTNKLSEREMPDVSGPDTRKKEKMARNQARRRQASHSASGQTRRTDKRRLDHIVDCGTGGFDVYNIETAMPKIDLDAIESHLRAAREEERRRRNDREEIRRRLAMGPDAEDLRAERGRKPSLQSRLQSGMNLQICFMNETPSDTESPGSENDGSSSGTVGSSSFSKLQQHQNSHQTASRPQVLSLPALRTETGASASSLTSSSSVPLDEADFFARQARLQTEARMALAQAKEMAHMQMEVERQRLKQSPITEMVRSSLEKVGVQLGEDRRRLSRVLLTELNVAQLQVVANDLHARIATLNEALVEGLLRRDDLHMEQDSMLVDVEDLTRYLGAKQESLRKRSSSGAKEQQSSYKLQQQSLPTTSKSREGQGATTAKASFGRDRMIKCLSTRRAA